MSRLVAEEPHPGKCSEASSQKRDCKKSPFGYAPFMPDCFSLVHAEQDESEGVNCQIVYQYIFGHRPFFRSLCRRYLTGHINYTTWDVIKLTIKTLIYFCRYWWYNIGNQNKEVSYGYIGRMPGRQKNTEA